MPLRRVDGPVRAKPAGMARPFSRIRWIALAILLLIGWAPGVAAQVVNVPGNYATIQSAIDNVPSGTTINVRPGTYAEALVVSIQNKTILVRGAGGPSATVIDAAGRNTTALHVLNSTGAITFEGLVGHPVMRGVFDHAMDHIDWAKWADVALVAPATANVLGKIAQGMADDALTTTLLAMGPDTASSVEKPGGLEDPPGSEPLLLTKSRVGLCP